MENNENKCSVYLRIRSPQIWETSSPAKSYIDFEQSTDQMVVIEKNPYVFDKIFFPESTQEEIFASSVNRNVDNLLRGYNSGVFALGASGSGKTSTIFGLRSGGHKGLVSKCLESLFEKLHERVKSSDTRLRTIVSVRFIEIYNEKVYDLLGDQTNDIYTKGSTYTGSSSVPVENAFEAEELLAKANKNRHVRATLNNASSSRSHAMFTICLNMKSEDSEMGSVLHLVDLAGSEGIRTTNHSGMAQQEGVKINQGLLALGKVIEAHNNGKKLIPYRDSVLTTVLKDCLNVESFLTLFACISPARKNKIETLSTIRFAQKCKHLDTKIIPEMNSYLKEQQRLNVRTPFKPYMQPLHRNETKTPARKTLAKTPGNRFNSFITPSAKKPASQARYTDVPKYSMFNSKESIDNATFSILNASTSTEVEGPTSSFSTVPSRVQSSQSFSFSPLMRRIEATIDSKLTSFMDSFKNQTTDYEKNGDLCVDLKKAVMKGIQEMESMNTFDVRSKECVFKFLYLFLNHFRSHLKFLLPMRRKELTVDWTTSSIFQRMTSIHVKVSLSHASAARKSLRHKLSKTT
jgi:hypothetical protein